MIDICSDLSSKGYMLKNPSKNSSDFLAIRQASEMLGVSIDTVRRWEKQGIISAERSQGGHRLFSRKKLDEFVSNRPLSISNAALELGISTSTLRRREKEGLISPAVGENGRRFYTKSILEEYRLAKVEIDERKKAVVKQGDAEPKAAEALKPQEKAVFVEELPEIAVLQGGKKKSGLVDGIKTALVSAFQQLHLGGAGMRLSSRQRLMGTYALLFALMGLVGVSAVLTGLSSIDAENDRAQLSSEEARIAGSLGNGSGSQRVLGVSKSDVNEYFEVNIPAFFSDKLIAPEVEIAEVLRVEGKIEALGADLDLGVGQITASNIVYSLQDQTGDVSFEAGEGISIDGLVISNTAITEIPEAEITSGHTFTGDVTGTLGGDGTTALTIAGDAVTLGTDTTGNYVATVADAGNSTVTVTGSGSEGATITLDVTGVNCTDCLTATEIADVYVLNTGDTMAGDFSPGTDNTYDLGTSSAKWSEMFINTVNATEVVATGATVFGGVRYYWPSADGSSLQLLSTDGAGNLSWTSVGGGVGDVTAIGDCSSGDCFTGSQGTQLVFNDADGDGTLQIANLTAARAWTLPDASGTIILSGHTFTGDITGTLDTDGSTALTIPADTIALATDTTGNYVATIADAGNSTVSINNSGTENAAVTLDVVDVNCTDCLNATEIEDIYLLNTGDTIAGNLLPDADSTYNLGSSPVRWLNIYADNIATGTLTAAGNITPTADNSYDLGTSSFGWQEIYANTVNTTELVNTGSVTLRGVKYLFPAADGSSNYVLSTDGSGDLSWSSVVGVGAVDGSGTSNYLSKWSDSDTLTNSLLQDNGLVLLSGGDLEPTTDSTFELGSLTLRWDGLYVGSINAEGNIVAATDSTYNLGSDTVRWLNVFADSVEATTIASGTITPLADSTYNFGASGTEWLNVFADSVEGSTLVSTGNLILEGLSTGTDNTVLVLNSSSQVVTDEIDSRVWGATLIDGSGSANTVAKFSDSDTLTDSLITDDGLVVQTAGDLEPTTDSTYELGSSALRWDSLYVGSINAEGNIVAATDSTYNLGSDSTRWLNVFADSVEATAIASGTITPLLDSTYDLGTTNTDWRELYVDTVNTKELINTGSVTLRNVKYLFPGADGTNSQALTTDGSGNLTWSTVAAGLGGAGTSGYITKWTAGDTIANSILQDDGLVLLSGGDFEPVADSTYELGSSALRWDSLYVGSINAEGNIIASVGSTYDLGASGTEWNELYVNTVNTGELVATGSVTLRGIKYLWPTADGSVDYVLSTDGSGNLLWQDVTAVSGGDISAVGDCTTGACFDGTAGTQLVFNDVDGDGTLAIADLSTTRTWTLPNRAGTFSLSGDTFTNDVTGTLDTSGATALTIAANAVALGTDTTGNYLATLVDAGNSTVTVTGSGSETAAVTLDVVDVNCTDCLNATEIEDIYILNTGDTIAGDFSPGSDSTYSLGSDSVRWLNVFADSIETSTLVMGGNIYPTTNSAYNLGTSDLGWSNIYGDSIYAGTATIFNSVEYFWPNADGTNNYVLSTDGSGSLAWTSVSGVGGLSGSGTTNYLSKWSNSNTLTDSLLVDNGINIGISVATPNAFKLEVAGNIGPSTTSAYDLGSASARWEALYVGSINAAGNILASTDSTYDLGSSSVDWRTLYVDSIDLDFISGSITFIDDDGQITQDNDGLFWNNNDNKLGIGTSAPSLFTLEVAGDVGPVTGNTYDLGAAARPWNELHVNTVNTTELVVTGSTTLNTVKYFWPSSDGSSGTILTTNGAGYVTWDSISGLGGVTTVGDCTSGACFDGTQGTQLVFNDASGDGTLQIANLTGARAWTLPDVSGTVILSGHTFTSDVTATLDTDGSTALTIAANAVALGTDTTGNYLATLADAGNSTITVNNSGSETAAVTLDVVDVNCTDCLNATEIEDIYILNTGDTIAGDFDPNSDSTYALGSSTLRWNSLFVGSVNAEGNIVPTATGNYDLGSSALRWNSLYVDSITAYGNIIAGTDSTYDLGASGTEWRELYAETVNTTELINTGSITLRGIKYLFPGADGTSSQALTTDGAGGLAWSTVAAGLGGSGTTNYMTKWTAGSTLGNSLMQDNGLVLLSGGDFEPTTDSTYELGSSALRWDSLYVGSINAEGNIIAATDSTYNLGANGTEWANLYADTLYATTATVMNSIEYFWPNADGTNNYVLSTDGSGSLTWESVSGVGGIDGSGTANYLTKWSDSNTLTNSLFQESGLAILAGGDLEPTTDSTFELGSAALRWDSLYVGSINAEGNIIAATDSTYNLGASGTEWANVYTDTLYATTATVMNSIEYFWPNADGTNNYVLSTDGSGSLTWESVSGVGGLDGSGSANYIPIWSDSNTLANSLFQQNGIAVLTGGDLLPTTDTTYALGSPTLRWNGLYVGSINAEGSIVPTNTGNYDLGSSSLRWNSLYVDSITAYGNILPGTDSTYNLGSDSTRWLNVFADSVEGSTLVSTGNLILEGLSTGTDNTVLVLNSSSQVVTDEIDSRVWGATLIDGSGSANTVAKFSDSDTLTDSLITDDGLVVQTAGDLEPTTDSTYELGSSALRWDSLYVGSINAEGNIVASADSTYDLGASGTEWANVYTDTLYATTATVMNSIEYFWPNADGTNGQALTTDASGALAWSTVAAGIDGSGTANYMTKWSDSDSLTNSILQDNGLVLLSGGDLEPTTDSTFELGSASLRWDSLYVGSIDIESSINPTTSTLSVAGNIAPTADSIYELGTSALRWDALYVGSINAEDSIVAANATISYLLKTVNFEIETNNPRIQLDDNNSDNVYLYNINGVFEIRPHDASSSNFVVLQTGNIGIGIADPSSFKLQVAGNVGPNTDSTYELGSSALRWDSLYVGSINAEGNIVASADSTYDLGASGTEWANVYSDTIYATTATVMNSIEYFWPNADGTNNYVLSTDGSGNLAWESVSGVGGIDGSGTANYMTKWSDSNTLTNSIIQDNGLVLLAGGDFEPTTDSTFELGSAALRWDALYVGSIEAEGSILAATDSTYDLGSSSIDWANAYIDTVFALALNVGTTSEIYPFEVTNGTDQLYVDMNDNALVWTDGTNSFDFDTDAGPTYSGNARPTRQVTLSPEFEGGSLTGDGGSNVGTMTTDFCEQGAHADIPDTNITVCNTAGDIHNYYNWTTGEGTVQDYDVWVRYRVPDNFAAWASNPIDVYGKRTDATNNAVTVYVYDTAGALENAGGTQVAGTTWTQTTVEATFGGTYTTGQYMTIRIVAAADTGGDSVQVGEINLDYLTSN